MYGLGKYSYDIVLTVVAGVCIIVDIVISFLVLFIQCLDILFRIYYIRLAIYKGNAMRKKYPRTPHLTWSEGCTSDDKMLEDSSHFVDQEVVVTIKMDGECTTLYNDHMHARSLDSAFHESRSWLKKYHSEFRFNIPPLYRICGENVYAQHSIRYENLDSYFYAFSIWNERNYCLEWDNMIHWLALIDSRLITAPVIYRGVFNKDSIHNAFKAYCDASEDEVEGYVVRLVEGFHYDSFDVSIAKYVRKNHVQTTSHWMFDKVTPNKLRT